MGLKCSLLGHDFGDTEIEREREERGDEVVIISREVETCRRCGEERVVSENKEVTTVTPAAEVEADPGTDTGDATDTDTDTDTDDEPTDAPVETEAETSTDDATEPDAGSPAGGLESAIEQVEDEEEFTSPEEDDAVILDADEETEERRPGEWPDEPNEPAERAASVETAPDDAAAVPDEAVDASETDTDEVAASGADADADADDADEATAAEVVAGTDDDTEVWSDGAEESSGTDSAFATAEDPAIDTDTIPEGSFYCPACGFHEPAAGSSLRAGDACPDCHRGYLERKG